MGFVYKDESMSDEERFILEWRKLEENNRELFVISIDFSDPNQDLEALRTNDGG